MDAAIVDHVAGVEGEPLGCDIAPAQNLGLWGCKIGQGIFLQIYVKSTEEIHSFDVGEDSEGEDDCQDGAPAPDRLSRYGNSLDGFINPPRSC